MIYFGIVILVVVFLTELIKVIWNIEKIWVLQAFPFVACLLLFLVADLLGAEAYKNHNIVWFLWNSLIAGAAANGIYTWGLIHKPLKWLFHFLPKKGV